MQLRDYQEEIVREALVAISNGENVVVESATGSGKSLCMIELCARYYIENPDKKILVLTAQVMLHEQTFKSFLKRFSDSVGQVCGSLGVKDSSKAITIGTIQSCGNVVPDFCVLDEAHQISETHFKFFKNLSEKFGKKIPVIGFTATPYKSDSGYIYGKDKFFSRCIKVRDLSWYIDKGYLVKPIAKMPHHTFDVSGLKTSKGEYTQASLDKLVQDNRDKIDLQIDDALKRLENRKKVIWSCVNISHAEMVAENLRSKQEKISIIHSKMNKELLGLSKQNFVGNESRHAISVSMLTTGIDIPEIDAVVLMRPIKSPTLLVQIVGRGLRVATGKPDNCIVLDYGSAFNNCGPLDAPYIVDKGKRKTKKVLVKVCKNCASIIDVNLKECPECGAIFVTESRDSLKHLSKKANAGAILSRDVKENLECVAVRPYVTLTRVVTRAGKDAIVVEYIPKNLLRGPIKEWILKDMRWSVPAAFKKLGMNVFSWEQALYKLGRHDIGMEAVHVTKEQFPKVKRIEYGI